MRIAKRVLDVVLSGAGLVVSLPLWLIAAVAVKLEDGGPIFFSQERVGQGGRVFRVHKFRSMVPDAEAVVGALQAREGDPRVTRVGRLLRKTSLDELPQLFNVLRGDMSLVGPRPTSFEAATYELGQTERLEVLPGITGLWQISGRSDLEFDERLRLDVVYIERASLWLDLKILLKTVGVVFSRRGAY